MVKYNQEIQTTLNTLNVDIGTKVQIGKLGLAERTLAIEEKRADREDIMYGEKEGEGEEEAKVGDLILPQVPNSDLSFISDIEERLRNLSKPTESNIMSISGSSDYKKATAV